MMSRRFATRLLLLAPLTLAAGCGDGGPPSYDRSAFVDAIAEESGEDEGSDRREEQVCLGTAVVDMIGVERLNDARITPEDLAGVERLGNLAVNLPDDAEAQVADALRDCMDLEAMKQSIVEASSEPIANGVDMSCWIDSIDPDAVIEAAAADFVVPGSSELSDAEAAGWLFGNTEPECIEQMLLDGMVADGALTRDQAGCAAYLLPDEVTTRFFSEAAAGRTPDASAVSYVQGAVESCRASYPSA